jgi:hypothetical protein
MAQPSGLRCPHCGTPLLDPRKCDGCGATLVTSSLFAGRDRELRPDWREWGLLVVTVVWVLLMFGSSLFLPAFRGWLFLVASVFIGAAILFRWESTFIAVKYLLGLGVVRGFLILMGARVDRLVPWMVVGAILMVLSGLLAYLVHYHDD